MLHKTIKPRLPLKVITENNEVIGTIQWVVNAFLAHYVQSSPDNSNLQEKQKKVRGIGSSSYRELRTNDSRWGRDASSMHTALQGTQEIY